MYKKKPSDKVHNAVKKVSYTRTNDIEIATDVMQKIRFSEHRVKNGKGSRPRPVDLNVYHANFELIKWI